MAYAAWMKAVDAERNILRHYALRCSRDLFGVWCVDVDWGRIGQRPNFRRDTFADEAEARRRVKELLRRRKSAIQRIGVGYEVLEEDGAEWLAEGAGRAASDRPSGKPLRTRTSGWRASVHGPAAQSL